MKVHLPIASLPALLADARAYWEKYKADFREVQIAKALEMLEIKKRKGVWRRRGTDQPADERAYIEELMDGEKPSIDILDPLFNIVWGYRDGKWARAINLLNRLDEVVASDRAWSVTLDAQEHQWLLKKLKDS